MQCSHVQDTLGALSLFEEIETNSSSDSPVKKSSLSSELWDLSLSLCFFGVLGVLEWDPEFVLDLSLPFLFLDLLVELLDLLDFFDLVEFFDLHLKISLAYAFHICR